MDIKWICQNNLGSTEDIERIVYEISEFYKT